MFDSAIFDFKSLGMVLKLTNSYRHLTNHYIPHFNGWIWCGASLLIFSWSHTALTILSQVYFSLPMNIKSAFSVYTCCFLGITKFKHFFIDLNFECIFFVCAYLQRKIRTNSLRNIALKSHQEFARPTPPGFEIRGLHPLRRVCRFATVLFSNTYVILVENERAELRSYGDNCFRFLLP